MGERGCSGLRSFVKLQSLAEKLRKAILLVPMNRTSASHATEYLQKLNEAKITPSK